MQTLQFDDDGKLNGVKVHGMPTYPNVTVKLTGEDGNVFHIIGLVAGAIRRGVGSTEAAAFSACVTACSSYDEVLQLVMRTVHVV